MQITRSQFSPVGFGQILLVAFLLFSVLAGFSAAANVLLHEAFHDHAHAEEHECVVTLFARGDVAAPDEPQQFKGSHPVSRLREETCQPLFLRTPPRLLPPERGPPSAPC